MKRSEVLLKLQRYYSIKHCMVEAGYITPNEFMDQALQLVEELGMLPPVTMIYTDKSSKNILCSEACVWDKE